MLMLLKQKYVVIVMKHFWCSIFYQFYLFTAMHLIKTMEVATCNMLSLKSLCFTSIETNEKIKSEINIDKTDRAFICI